MNKIRNLLPSLPPELKDLLRTGTTYSEPGFIGSVPILLWLRAFTLGGILLRFWLHGELSLMFFVLIVGAIIWAFIVTSITYSRWRDSRKIQGLFILADILLISSFYWLTGDVRSDLFLFYFLPLLVAAEYFDVRELAFWLFAITCAFGTVVLLLISTPVSITERGGVFLLREIFFLFIVGALSWRQIGRRQRLSRLISALHEIGHATASALEFDNQLDNSEPTAHP